MSFSVIIVLLYRLVVLPTALKEVMVNGKM